MLLAFLLLLSFLTILAVLFAVEIFAAVIPAFSDLAPVMTILPVEKMSPVVLGSLMRITTAENRAGLYSALRHH